MTEKLIMNLLLVGFILQVNLSLALIWAPIFPQEQGYIVPGIHKEYLPQPIFYESYIPLILEYQTPKWNKTEITFNNWYTCVSETAPYRYSCPVVFHMNQAMLNLHVDFAGLHPVTDTDSEWTEHNSQNYFERLTTTGQFCSKIQKHFSGMWINVSDIEKYLKVIQNCRLPVEWEASSEMRPLAVIERSISDFNYSVRTPFTRMENNFYNTFYKNIMAPESEISNNASTTNSSSALPSPLLSSKMDLVASALLSNARTTLQSGILGVYYAEKNRWIHALSDCSTGVIPQSIVTKSKLLNSLTKISLMKPFQDTHDLSINPNLMSKYYSLPLTDCSHTSADSFVVRVLVPVIKKNRSKSLQLMHTHTIPFEYKGHVCKIKLSALNPDHDTGKGFFQEGHGSYYIFDEVSGLAFPTDCKANGLCQVSEYVLNTRSNSDRCVSALMSRNHSVIGNHCQLQCRKQDLRENPIVTRIHSNQYVITGSPLSFVIKCKGQSSTDEVREVQIDSEQVGAHLVNLPCNCRMVLPKHYVFYGEGSCTTENGADGGNIKDNLNQNPNTPSVIPIIPFHFARMKPNSLNNNRNAHVNNDNETGQFYYENLKQDSPVNLADFIDISRIDLLINNVKSDEDFRRNYGAVMSEVDRSTDLALGSSSSVKVLWISFFIFVVVVLSIQAYLFYLLRQFQVVSYPKDDRILYRVPDSPIMY